MAETCTQSIQSKIDNGTIGQVYWLQKDEPYDFVVTGQTNVLVYFQTVRPETVQFNTSFSSPLYSVDITITIYKYDSSDGTFQNLGSVQIFDLIQSFQKDLQLGEFFICIHVNNPTHYFDGSITGNFTQFQYWANLFPRAYSGESLKLQTIEEGEYVYQCPREIRFYMVDGYLPEGLTLNIDGKICGTPKNLDCIDWTANLSPSVDWFYEYLPSGQWFPKGLTARFKVRIEMEDYEDIAYDEQWFCIRVYNDWSLDRDRLLESLPMHDIRKRMAEPLPKPETLTIPNLCNPCPESESIQPQDILPSSLCPCELDVDMIPIPMPLIEEIEENLEAKTILPWWYALLASRDELCCHELEFLERLESNKLFLEYITSLEPPNTSDEEARATYEAAINEMNNFLQITKSTQIRGRNTTDIDYIFLNKVNEQNQLLEMEFVAFTGESGIFDTSIPSNPLFDFNFYSGEILSYEEIGNV